ncbi:HAAAP family serine/threonine permease [Vibrio metschnikovii]|uniref:HAAAP family serine/threonine permease n=1 Tax=Vibrio metschnikovii TaxID=28172 RepID=UPI00164AB3CE|nr:HAAAP family serine/threonine permease [Vibrio metschnikovii]MBC5830294.1 HAAAP family serine/threonine permease [Vibrio metschnikovii]
MLSTQQDVTITTVSPSTWRKSDTVWMLGLYGTAIGAGVLFLPINAGIGGLIPLILMGLLAFPMTFYAHRGLARLVLSSTNPAADITQVMSEHFGKKAGRIFTLLYFVSIFPILLVYGVSITNTVESFMLHQLGIIPPPRFILSFCLLMSLIGIVRYGEELIVKTMSILVYPFISVLMLLALYLIPHWNGAIFNQDLILHSVTSGDMWRTLLLTIPVMVFSFSHTPIISTFAKSKRKEYSDTLAEKKCSKILGYAHMMMVASVMFFVLSCVLTLSPQQLAEAKAQNITILSYLANYLDTPVIEIMAPMIAFIAISKSFLGTYIGAQEGCSRLISEGFEHRGYNIKPSTINTLTVIVMLMTTWLVATLNPSVLGMIEVLCGPIIALILYIIPMYAIQKIPALEKYRGLTSNTFVVIMGIIAISATVYGLL